MSAVGDAIFSAFDKLLENIEVLSTTFLNSIDGFEIGAFLTFAPGSRRPVTERKRGTVLQPGFVLIWSRTSAAHSGYLRA